MKNFSVFDIVGPIMIGPSSSHTAGAARLAKIAGVIAGQKIVKVKFLLHGSFAKTYKGHGTDRALVAGILGMEPWDERLRNSFEIAKEHGLEIEFEEADLGDVHPNTVKFVITKEDGEIVEVTGSSVGGGNILVSNIQGREVQFRGDYPTVIIEQEDSPGIISKITSLTYEENINIAFMRVYRQSKGSKATMTFETDSLVPERVIRKIESVPGVVSVKVINPVMEGEE
ncbi:L-serine ammonia-lyase, iron-sulfur-dependent subunit beta [Clostridium sp. KNHs214]|uniref:L-serine ammonia-lyase, iron-sulfur-dependent subunit beta n=1 Tax=Clostridium sp. KNHs214 TaxID=1540257 RepID=UPI0005590C00|nr:L-serine ammonia-lyase, iron-sulfur-dependent subunit beta [Clostridium sp. KNHs214]